MKSMIFNLYKINFNKKYLLTFKISKHENMRKNTFKIFRKMCFSRI